MGLLVMPRNGYAAAARVRPAGAAFAAAASRTAAWPVLGGRTGGRHCDLDAADADAHERTDLEHLETNDTAGGLRELGVVKSDTARACGPTSCACGSTRWLMCCYAHLHI